MIIGQNRNARVILHVTGPIYTAALAYELMIKGLKVDFRKSAVSAS